MGPSPLMKGHETVCMLNAGDAGAHVEITIFFLDPRDGSGAADQAPSVQQSDRFAGIAEFERELLQERIRSSMVAAKARGKRLGSQPG
jgi:hypothetical protein